MDMWVVTIVLLLVVLIGAWTVAMRGATREVPDNQRLAIVRAGSFRALGGPGPTKVLPVLERAVVLCVDDVGAALVEGRAEFEGVDIPVRASAFFEAGEAVRIVGFDRDQAAVIVKA